MSTILDVLKIKDATGNWISVPGLKGEDGKSIESVTFQSNGTLTITDSEGAETTFLGVKAAIDSVDDIVIISDTEPTSPTNKIWIDSDADSVQVPTMDDLNLVYSVLPEKTIEDQSLVTFNDGAASAPLKELLVDINHIQDLNGYDYAWLGGFNKNKMPLDFVLNTISGIETSLTSDGGIKFVGEATAQVIKQEVLETPLPAGTYTVSFNNSTAIGTGGCRWLCLTEDNATITDIYLTAANKTDTFTAESPIAKIRFQFEAGQVLDNVVYPQLEAGSNKTDFVPYENICPISGFGSAAIEKNSKNWLPPWVNTHTEYGITWEAHEDGTVSSTGTATNDTNLPTHVSLPAGNYILNGCPEGGSSSTFFMRVLLYHGSTLSSFANDFGNGASFTVDGNETDIQVFPAILSGVTAPSDLWKPMIRLADGGDDSYEQYTNEEYMIIFPTAAGPVYGGTLDVVNGVLTINNVLEVFNSSTGFTKANYALSDRYVKGLANTAKVISPYSLCVASNYFSVTERRSAEAHIGIISGNRFDVYWPLSLGIDTVAKLNTVLSENPLQVVYELETPIVYQLTPVEVKTLLGTNHIWADTGNINTITYRADIAKYIQEVIGSLGG